MNQLFSLLRVSLFLAGSKTSEIGLPFLLLTLLLLNTAYLILANSVDPDQLASGEAN